MSNSNGSTKPLALTLTRKEKALLLKLIPLFRKMQRQAGHSGESIIEVRIREDRVYVNELVKRGRV